MSERERERGWGLTHTYCSVGNSARSRAAHAFSLTSRSVCAENRAACEGCGERVSREGEGASVRHEGVMA